MLLASSPTRSPLELWFEHAACVAQEGHAPRLDLDTYEQSSTADNQIDFRRFRMEAASQDSPALSSQVTRGETLATFSESLWRELTVPESDARRESYSEHSQSFPRDSEDSDKNSSPSGARTRSRRRF